MDFIDVGHANAAHGSKRPKATSAGLVTKEAWRGKCFLSLEPLIDCNAWGTFCPCTLALYTSSLDYRFKLGSRFKRHQTFIYFRLLPICCPIVV